MHRLLLFVLVLIVSGGLTGCKKNTDESEKPIESIESANRESSKQSANKDENIVLPVPDITVAYTVPETVDVPEAPGNALDSTGNRTVKGVIDSTIQGVMHSTLARINEKISAINPDDHVNFLKKLKAVDTGKLRFKSNIARLDTCTESGYRDYALKLLNDSCKNLNKDELLEITVPMLKTDSNGVLIAGLVVNDSPDEKRKLNIIKKAKGNILIVTPQIVTAWPGNEKSAVGVIMPGDGPWEVLGYCSPTERLAERREMLRNNSATQNYEDVVLFKSYGEYVLIKASGIGAAWLALDSCAYIWDEYSLQGTVDAYKKGCVIFSQGYWKGEDEYGYPEPETEKALMWGSLQTIDFINLIEWSMRGNGKEFANKRDAEIYSECAPYSGQDFNINKIVKYKIEFIHGKIFEVGEIKYSEYSGTWERQISLSATGGLERIYGDKTTKVKKLDPVKLLKIYNIKKIDELFKK